jgi:MoaA/NifB/PqqE/SkfB family radical SAM enzyme
MLNYNLIKEVELDLTGSCNLKCSLCALQRIDTVVKFHPELNDIIAFLDQFENLESIFLCGEFSEPLAYKHIIPLIKYIQSRKIPIDISTNGSIHSISWWEELSGILTETDNVSFCIDGHTQELHETYRVGSSLDKVIQNAKAFIDINKQHDSALTIRFEHNTEYIDMISDMVALVGFSNHDIVNCKPSPLNIIKPILNLSNKFDKIIEYGSGIIDRRDIGEEFTLTCKSKERGSIHITNELKVFPCCEFILPVGGHEPIEAWNGEYDDILKFKNNPCWVCENSVLKLSKLILPKEDYLI